MACRTRREDQVFVMGLVRSTSFKRKRVSPSIFCGAIENGGADCIASISAERQCAGDSFCPLGRHSLESLPQEILIRILCGVEHDDLRRLVFVSKSIGEATLIAKQSHFAYTTPRKTRVIQKVDDFQNCSDVQAPNAPKQQSRTRRLRLSAKELASVSIALFNCDVVDH